MNSKGSSRKRVERGAARAAVAPLVMAILAAGCGDETGGAATTGSGAEGCFQLADGRCVEETFHNPPVLEPNADGVYELELRPTEVMIDGKRQCGRAYNGMYPAPTIDTKAAIGGEKRQIRVNLKNGFTRSDYEKLSEGECTCVDTESMMSCTPEGGHGGHGTCMCTTADEQPCHIFDFNVTNIHAHGSHVRPDYAAGGGCVEADGLRCRACKGDGTGPRECFFSDDVISRVNPGEGVQHRWDIDEDGVHHAGLNWYHPHIHGSTAIQVSSGATGAWIVRGALDELPGIKDARERLIFITTPPVGNPPLEDGEPCDEDHITFNNFYRLGDANELQLNLVNGIRRPRMVMAPGQIERWRFLHGSFLDEIFLGLFRGKDSECKAIDLSAPPIRLTQIGRDGVPLLVPPTREDWPYAPDIVFMAPGYRIEAMLDGSALKHGDTLCLMAERIMQADDTGTTDEVVGVQAPPTKDQLLDKVGNGDVVAIVNVTDDAGPATETEMPDLSAVAEQAPSTMLQGGKLDGLARCEEVQKIDGIENVDQLSALFMLFLETAPDGCACPDHNINCKNFEYTDRKMYPYDRVLKKGAVDHWRVMAGFDGHPFHIHINPFLVCPLPPEGSEDPNAVGRLFEPPFAHWRDTYMVNLGRQMDMLAEYRAFTGTFVDHCHKLTHEDHGMMELLRICDPEVEPCDELCSGGPCGWKTCLEGDESCARARAATACFFDPSACQEAALRCTTCGEDQSCPPGAYCREDEDIDEQRRCAPGCTAAEDCPLTDACQGGGCVPAPCMVPCEPGQVCAHGVCN